MKNRPFTKKPPKGDLSNPSCASRGVFQHVMGRWGGLILRALLQEKVLRFAELRDSVKGISEKVLSQTLRNFERDGLVNRRSYGEVPPRVEYSLTDVGEAIALEIKGVCALIEEHAFSISQFQVKFDQTRRVPHWQSSSQESSKP